LVLRRGSFRQGRIQRPRRESSWGVGPGGTVTTSIANSSSVLVGGGIVPLTDGITLVRTRGELSLYLSSATAALAGFQGAFGIGIVEAPAFSAGIASVPTPISEADSENWLYHTFFSCVAIEPTETFSNSGSAAVRFSVDSRAMRKFDLAKRIYAAIEVVEVGTAVLQVDFDSRMLFKLS